MIFPHQVKQQESGLVWIKHSFISFFGYLSDLFCPLPANRRQGLAVECRSCRGSMLSWLRWTQWIFESINDGNRNRSHWGFGSMEPSWALHLFWKNVSSIGLYLLDFVLTVSIFPEKEIVTAYITFYPWCIILLTIETQKLRPGLKLFTRHNIGTARKE